MFLAPEALAISSNLIMKSDVKTLSSPNVCFNVFLIWKGEGRGLCHPRHPSNLISLRPEHLQWILNFTIYWRLNQNLKIWGMFKLSKCREGAQTDGILTWFPINFSYAQGTTIWYIVGEGEVEDLLSLLSYKVNTIKHNIGIFKNILYFWNLKHNLTVTNINHNFRYFEYKYIKSL